MGCHCHRTTCIWLWIIMTFLGISLLASGTYFSVSVCSAANIIEMDCLIPLSFCGAGTIVFILVGFGCSCLPARSKQESEEEGKEEEWEECIESIVKLSYDDEIRETITNETTEEESERSHGKPTKNGGSKRKLDGCVRSHLEPARKKKGRKTPNGSFSENLELILKEASKHPEAIQKAADFFAKLAERKM